MKRFSRTGLTLSAIAVVAMSGCVNSNSQIAQQAKLLGYVASPSKAQLEVSASQIGVEQLNIKRVLAPDDAWLVVNADVGGQPGDQLATSFVLSGESRDVAIPLENLKTPQVIVTLYADRGTRGTFDFDPMSKTQSADRPIIVGGRELAAVVAVRQYGIPVDASKVALVADDQIGASKSLLISRVSAPGAAWVVVRIDKDGGQGQRIGLAHVRSGESTGVVVPLDPLPLSSRLAVSLYADRGTPNIFDFDPADPLNSVDQPFLVNGVEYANKVRVR